MLSRGFVRPNEVLATLHGTTSPPVEATYRWSVIIMSKIPCILLADEPNTLAITQPKFWFGQNVLLFGRYPGVITGMEWIAPRSFWTYNGMHSGWVYTIDFEDDEPKTAYDDDIEPLTLECQKRQKCHDTSHDTVMTLAVTLRDTCHDTVMTLRDSSR